MMAEMDRGVGELHLAVCRRFGEAVRSADGKWDRPSPCDGWDARAVLEHVIGFHDVLLLRPLGLKPDRPRDDPQRRWGLTYGALERAFDFKMGRTPRRYLRTCLATCWCTPGTWPGRSAPTTGWTPDGASCSTRHCRATPRR